jgi:hypothetical protein
MGFITSPFVVVPVMAALFLACIFYATLTGGEHFQDTVPDESSPRPDTH